MKIAVLGANGFVGSNVAKHLKQHSVFPITRNTLNLLNSTEVRDYLKSEKFDVIVNCAAVMTNNDSLHDARNNLGMFMNFYNNAELFGKFINTASGAEFDRETNIDNAEEQLIFDRMPADSYGWGQNIKSRLCAKTDNFYNIRIFNCFGYGEPSTRIFPKFLSNGTVDVYDRYFDYFNIRDLCNVISHCIENNWTVKDVNAVYSTKYKISEVLAMFCKINNLEPNFKVVGVNNNNYTGSDSLLKTLNIELSGLENGLLAYKGNL